MSPYATFPLDDKIAEDEVIHHISNTRPRAKKRYKCSCCNGWIEKGEKHYKNVYKIGTDDTIRWERSHIHCPGWEP